MNNIVVYEDGALAISGGKIVAVGTTTDVMAALSTKSMSEASFEQVVEAQGKVILPGLVEAHTHAVYAGDRAHEFAMKLAGATYMEVHKAGGGIGFTVAATREATPEALHHDLMTRLDAMVAHGSTTIEVKSGYGLDAATEVKMLETVHKASKTHPARLIPTYLAHSVPKGMTSAEAVNDVINVQLPAVLEAKAAGRLDVEIVDVFCEKGVFNHDETKVILEAGAKAGLRINFHGDELSNTASAELGAELGACGVSHLECVSDGGIKAMAMSGTVAVLLPSTAYILRIEQPPARKLIDSGVPVALASDYNPNVPCLSLPFIMHLGCVAMHMTLPEALTACTINAAAALGVSDKVGSLEVGKEGDFIVLDSPRWEHVVYQLADVPLDSVYSGGKRVFKKTVDVGRK
ncbi:Imidazolonepropionase [Carpediemonas membranifera]|uniref:Probable imidazolonepropionase n=1 Tax=Carpediemonas membranifera TaxID=201153 RepID=A0A8J6AQA9_9EUKA|nr:Imidazolonepropionase [Carpediemonas membranifera]|eukprot:KAG9391201.1 Imidazolonepropionase [Carpediemonas membranifera]